MVVEPREAPSRLSTFTLTATEPRQIHLSTTFADSPNHLHTEGIYTLTGDTLTYCVAPPGQRRPAKFATVQGDGNTLVVLRRRTTTAGSGLSSSVPVVFAS